jgi:hypothetical protein
VLNRRETLRFCNFEGWTSAFAGIATPIGRFELLELMEREQSGGDLAASLSYRDRPLRHLSTFTAATIRARDELLAHATIIWEMSTACAMPSPCATMV